VEKEGWRVRKDGSQFWALAVITALYDDTGNLRGFAKVTRDMTGRRRAEEALVEREHQLAEAQRLARLGSWEWDVASDRVHWSDELFRLFGVSPAEFVPTYLGYRSLVHPDDQNVIDSIVSAAIEEGQPFSFIHRVRLPNGNIRWLQARGRALFDEHGAVSRLQGTAQDITDQRQAEEYERRLSELTLRQHQALEINDDIVQGLAVADLALALEQYDKARQAVSETLDAARRFVTDLLRGGEEELVPGSLRRESSSPDTP